MRPLAIFLTALGLCATVSGAESESAYLHRAHASLHRFVLDNGLVCLVQPDHSAPVVAVQIWVGTGSVDEEEFLGAGLSHYMEHMIFKGTATRGPTDITRELNEAGGEVNAYTSTDRTVFHTVLPSENWKVGVDVLSDAVMHAALPEEEWAREKKVIVREMVMGRDDPSRVLWKLTNQTAYRVHPYRFPVIGYEEIFNRMTRDDLVTFFKRNYVPDNMIAVVAGDIDPAEVESYLRSVFADFQRRPRQPVVIPQEPDQVAPRSARVTGPYNVTRLRLAYHATAMNDPDTPVLDVLSYVVGEGRSSRLVREFKERRQLVFSIDASSYTPKDPGLFGIDATLAPEREGEVMAALRDEVASWRTNAFDEAAVAKAKRQLTVQELSGLRTMKGQAGSLASGEFFAGDPRYGERYLEQVQQVTAADLKRVAAVYLRPENETLVVLAPNGTPAPAAKSTAPAATATPVTRHTTRDGVPLLVREDHRLPFVNFCVAFRGGLLSETEADNGITQSLADLLTRGTDTRSAEEVAEQVERRGGTLTAFSGWNSFGLQASCLKQDMPFFMELLAECVTHPALDAGELEKQKKVQVAAIQEQQEKPFFLAMESLKQMLFPEHPYHMEPMGHEASVMALTREALVRHQQRLVNRSNMVISVFGDVTADDARALADQDFTGLPAGEAGPPTATEPTPELPAQTLRKEPRKQAILLVGYPGLAVDDPRVDALNALKEIMSGLSSDLGIEVREKRGLVYYVGALQRTGPEPGLFTFYAGTRPEAVDEVERLIQEQAARAREGGLRQEELDRAREQLIAAHQMSLQDNAGLAQSCALNELYGLGYDYAFETEERLCALKLDDLREVASALLEPEHQAVAILLPEQPEGGESQP